MGLQDHAQRAAPAGVQRAERLIQQPQRTRRGDQAGEGQAAALAGRQLAHLQIQQGLQRQHVDRRGDPVGVGPEPLRLKGQLLAGSARALQPVEMAEPMNPRDLKVDNGGCPRRLYALRPVSGFRPRIRRCVSPPEGDGSGVRTDEPGQGSKQTGLARAVGSDQGQGLARGQREGQVAEQHPLAARHRQAGHAQHRPPVQLRTALNTHVGDMDSWTNKGTIAICAVAAAGVRRARRGPVRPAVDRAIVQPDCRAALTRGSLSMPSNDSLKTRQDLSVGRKKYAYYSLPAAEEAGLAGISRLPRSMKVLLENLLRNEDGVSVTEADLKAVAAWLENKGAVEHEIAFRPARVLMQDFTGVPAVVDLAGMRDAMTALGADASKINPLNPVDLVIDHSVMVDNFGTPKAFGQNVEREYERNIERYNFLRWGSSAFNNFRVVPPGTGICHQVNLENLAQTVWTLEEGKKTVAYPDTVVGT